jgi:uncharacterized protein (UPF0261 family)
LAIFFFSHFPCAKALRRKYSVKISILVLRGRFFAFDCKGGPFHDPEGPEFFGKVLKKLLKPGTSLHLLPYHINDPEFVAAIIETLGQVLK